MRLGLAEKTVLVALAQAMVSHETTSKNKQPSTDTLAKGEALLKSVYNELPSYEVIIPPMLEHGIFELKDHVKLQPGVPLKPMLAKPTKAITEVRRITYPNIRPTPTRPLLTLPIWTPSTNPTVFFTPSTAIRPCWSLQTATCSLSSLEKAMPISSVRSPQENIRSSESGRMVKRSILATGPLGMATYSGRRWWSWADGPLSAVHLTDRIRPWALGGLLRVLYRQSLERQRLLDLQALIRMCDLTAVSSTDLTVMTLSSRSIRDWSRHLQGFQWNR